MDKADDTRLLHLEHLLLVLCSHCWQDLMFKTVCSLYKWYLHVCNIILVVVDGITPATS